MGTTEPEGWLALEETLQREWQRHHLSDAQMDERLQLVRWRWDRVQGYPAERGALFAEVFSVLTRHDPIGIAFPEVPDEYELVAETITPCLSEAADVDDVRHIVRDNLARWFSVDIADRRPEALDAISHDLWHVRLRYKPYM